MTTDSPTRSLAAAIAKDHYPQNGVSSVDSIKELYRGNAVNMPLVKDTLVFGVIEKGIPAPAGHRGTPPKFPFAIMEIGDSFIHPGPTHIAACAASYWGRKLKRKHTCASVYPGNPGKGPTRVWRIK